MPRMRLSFSRSTSSRSSNASSPLSFEPWSMGVCLSSHSREVRSGDTSENAGKARVADIQRRGDLLSPIPGSLASILTVALLFIVERQPLLSWRLFHPLVLIPLAPSWGPRALRSDSGVSGNGPSARDSQRRYWPALRHPSRQYLSCGFLGHQPRTRRITLPAVSAAFCSGRGPSSRAGRTLSSSRSASRCSLLSPAVPREREVRPAREDPAPLEVPPSARAVQLDRAG